MSSTTLASLEMRNGINHHQPSSSTPCGKQIKSKIPREVVLHHPIVAPPPEDWLLYPDEVIIIKHSSVRRRRSCAVKGPPFEDSRRPWIRRDPITEKSKETSRVHQEVQHREEIPSTPIKSPDSGTPAWARKGGEAKRPPKPKYPERLPTPDLSDVEEDGFWSCCGSSESSTLRELDSA